MNRRERLNHETIDEQKRRQIIIDYICDHKGCIFQNIDGQSIIGRVKASRILKELKKEGIVIPHQSAKNKRDIKLFLNDDNPFISLPNELKEFKQFFIP